MPTTFVTLPTSVCAGQVVWVTTTMSSGTVVVFANSSTSIVGGGAGGVRYATYGTSVVEPPYYAPEVMERARELLLSHLTDEQRDTFERNDWFVVEGGRSGQRYRIRGSAYAGNVEVLDGDAVAHRLCAHCDAAEVPLADNLLAQKLMIEADEDAFLAVANRRAA